MRKEAGGVGVEDFLPNLEDKESHLTMLESQVQLDDKLAAFFLLWGFSLLVLPTLGLLPVGTGLYQA